MTDVQDAQRHTITQRVQIIDAAIAVFHDTDYADADLSTVAAAAGLTVTEVRAHFHDWDSLVVATLDRWNGNRMWALRDFANDRGAVAFLQAVVAGNVEDPALTRLLAATFPAGANPRHPASAYYRQQYALFFGFVRQTLEHDVAVGREASTTDPTHGAEQLVALYEGLSLQSLLRDFDLQRAFDRGVARLRHGWTEEYVEAVEAVEAVGV